MRSLAIFGVLLLLLGAGCSGGSGSDGGSSGEAASTEVTGASSGSNERYVSQADYGDAWPLTLDGGMLRCEGPGAVSFTSSEGIVYSINGTAKAWSRTNNLAWKDIDTIWADDPSAGGRKMNVGPLVAGGLALCDD